MASLRINALANYGGQAVAGLAGYAVIPFYLRYLGPEGYGMVGFLLVLQSTLAVLDFGLGTTATREVSRLSGQADGRGEMRHLLRTLEFFYYAMAALIVLGLVLGSGQVAARWIKAASLSDESLRTCLLCAAATVGLRWPVALYGGILRGRERQVTLNAIGSSLAIGKALAGILILAFVWRSIVAFYVVQLGAAVLELAIMAVAAWRAVAVQSAERPAFRRDILKRVWGFSAKLALISGFAMLLKQVDRWAVTVLLPIEQLGFYTNAVLLGMGISRVFGPIQNAVFPRLTRLLAGGEPKALAETFHRACQCVMALVAPVVALCAALAEEVLHLWLRTGDPSGKAAAAGAAPLTITALAMLFNSAMAIPYSLQVAAGLTRLPLWTNGLGAVLLVPLSFLAVRQWGLAGAAYAWLTFNVLYYLILPQFVFARVLSGHKLRWYLHDTLPFIAASLLLTVTIRLLGNLVADVFLRYSLVAALLAAYAAALWLLLPALRELASQLPVIRPLLARFRS